LLPRSALPYRDTLAHPNARGSPKFEVRSSKSKSKSKFEVEVEVDANPSTTPEELMTAHPDRRSDG
jgi:hypothetical protein